MLKPTEREDWNRRNTVWPTERVAAALGGRVERPVETGDGVGLALDCLVRGKRP